MIKSDKGFEKEVSDLLCKEYKTQKVKLSEINSKEKRIDKKIFEAKVDYLKLNITIGSDLENLYRNTKTLNELLPNYTCRAEHFFRKKNRDIFIQEYFEGESLDELIDKNKISEKDLNELISRIFNIFSSIEIK